MLSNRLQDTALRYFLEVVRSGSLSEAAVRLNVSPSAVSRQVAGLEAMLGVPLFERLPRGMRPTWYGETMIRHARMALANLNQAHDEIGALKQGHYGQVGIGAITSPGLSLLPAAVALVKQEHPSLRISLDIETSPVLLERLDQGKLDIVVGRLYEEHDKSNLRYEPLTEELVCAITRPGHPLSARSGLTLRDMLSASWIVPPAGSVLRHRFDLMFQQDGLAPPVNVVETAALLFMTRMLQQSDMVAVTGADVAHYYASHGIVAVLPMAMPCHMDAFGIITRTDRLLSPAAKVMMRALKQASLVQYGRKLEVGD